MPTIALVTAEGLAKSLIPEVDVIAGATPFIATVVTERMAPDRLQQEAMYALLTLGSLVDRLPVTVSQLLDDVDAQRVRVGIDHHRSAEDQMVSESRFRRAMLGGFAMALLIAGALVTGSPVLGSLSAATVGLWLLAVIFALGGLFWR